MKVVGCMATYNKRANTRQVAINSIKEQVDFLYVVDNSASEIDKSDNAKFEMLDKIKQPCIMLLLDDDIIYPPNYRKVCEEKIEMYGCIITFHGRKLLGEGMDYYKNHARFRCTDKVDDEIVIDVAGTGVTAFRTDYFHPNGLSYCPIHNMSDLIFSLAAARAKKQIGLMSHDEGWIRHIDNEETIFKTESKTGTPIQNHIADNIFKLNNP